MVGACNPADLRDFYQEIYTDRDKISEVARRRVVMTLAVRNLRSLDDVRSLVELFERAR